MSIIIPALFCLPSGLVTDDSALNKINDNYFLSPKIFSSTTTRCKWAMLFPPPALEHHMGKMLVGIEQALNMMDTTRKNKRIPLILYDGISTNIITGDSLQTPILCALNKPAIMFCKCRHLHIQDQRTGNQILLSTHLFANRNNVPALAMLLGFTCVTLVRHNLWAAGLGPAKTVSNKPLPKIV